MSIPITIVIPVYKRTTYFREALRSALAQTVPVEVLVVDDGTPGPPDGFQKIIAEEGNRAKYIYCETNLGQAGHWNRCLALAKTPWVSMLHDDDALPPNAIELLLKAEKQLPGRAIYFGLDDSIDERGIVRLSKKSQVDHLLKEIRPETYALQNQFCAAGALFNRETALSLGGFNPHLKMTPDWDLWVRLCIHSGAVRVNEITAQYRDYFDLNRGTSQQELNGKKLLRISVQLHRNIARIKKIRPGFQCPADANHQTSLMARGLLCIVGSQLNPKGRFIYFAYVRRLRNNRGGFLGKASNFISDLQCWMRIAYSHIRPLWLRMKKPLFNK